MKKHEISQLKGKFRRCEEKIHALLVEKNNVRHDGSRRASFATRKARKLIIESSFRYLHWRGYIMAGPSSFKPRHMDVLFEYWKKENFSPATFSNNLSVLRTFCGWLNKEQTMIAFDKKIKANGDYDKYVKKETATKIDKSWTTIGVDILDKIEEVERDDVVVAQQLSLEFGFGMRPQESWLFLPHIGDNGNCINIAWGTKNGLPRIVPVENDVQREILEYAKKFAKSEAGSTIPKEYSLKQWGDHFYYIIRKHEIKRTEGIVAYCNFPNYSRTKGTNSANLTS